MELIEFIHTTNRVETLYDLIQVFCTALNGYGYNKFMPFSMDGAAPEVIAPINGKLHFNPQLFKLYDRRGAVSADPVHQLFMCTNRPFTWLEVNELPLNLAQRRVMEMRQESGLKSGFCVPVTSCHHEIIGISISSEVSDARCDLQARSFVYAMTNQYLLRRDELLHHNDSFLPPYGTCFS